MLYKVAFCYFRSALFNRHALVHKCRHFHSYLSVKQALETDASRNIPVLIQGWVRALRHHKHVVFLHVNDGSSLEHLQIVSDVPGYPDDATHGSCVKVNGTLVPSEHDKQAVEVRAESIEVIGSCDRKNYPFKSHKKYSLDDVRQFPHLRPRTLFFGALLRIRNAAMMAVHKYFQREGFCLVHTPILTANDCEGAGEVFAIEPADKNVLLEVEKDVGTGIMDHFFGVPTFLTVSGQLHLEIVNGAFSKVYTFGPTFRADNSRTRHHLSEFSMVEAELAFTQSLDDIMKVVEALLKFIAEDVLSSCQADVHYVQKRAEEETGQSPPSVKTLLEDPFMRLTYDEAVDVLCKHNDQFQNRAAWGIDFYKEHERFLVKHCGNGVPVFVTDYPAEIKPFYARRNDDGRTVAAVDLLAPGVGEICGGSLREERLDLIRQSLAKSAFSQSLDWYLDLRRFGSAPHGGFGVGFERYLQTVLGVKNIRDMVPFPRTANNCRL